MQILVEIGPVVLEKQLKVWKTYKNNDKNDDGQQSSIIKAGLSLWLGWAKNETSFLIKNEILFKGIYQLEAFNNLDLNYSYHLNKVNVYIQIPTNLFGH